jgi:hypothetical protein
MQVSSADFRREYCAQTRRTGSVSSFGYVPYAPALELS